MCLTKFLKIWKSIGFPSGRSGADLNELMGGFKWDITHYYAA